MSNLSNRELLLKYCYVDQQDKNNGNIIRDSVKEFISTFAKIEIIDFLADFFNNFIYAFFKNKELFPELRSGFNKLRASFIRCIYYQMQNIKSSNTFISKDFYDNYYSWLNASGLLEAESGKAIEHFSLSGLFKYKYKFLYNIEYSNNQE